MSKFVKTPARVRRRSLGEEIASAAKPEKLDFDEDENEEKKGIMRPKAYMDPKRAEDEKKRAERKLKREIQQGQSPVKYSARKSRAGKKPEVVVTPDTAELVKSLGLENVGEAIDEYVKSKIEHPTLISAIERIPDEYKKYDIDVTLEGPGLNKDEEKEYRNIHNTYDNYVKEFYDYLESGLESNKVNQVKHALNPTRIARWGDDYDFYSRNYDELMDLINRNPEIKELPEYKDYPDDYAKLDPNQDKKERLRQLARFADILAGPGQVGSKRSKYNKLTLLAYVLNNDEDLKHTIHPDDLKLILSKEQIQQLGVERYVDILFDPRKGDPRKKYGSNFVNAINEVKKRAEEDRYLLDNGKIDEKAFEDRNYMLWKNIVDIMAQGRREKSNKLTDEGKPGLKPMSTMEIYETMQKELKNKNLIDFNVFNNVIRTLQDVGKAYPQNRITIHVNKLIEDTLSDLKAGKISLSMAYDKLNTMSKVVKPELTPLENLKRIDTTVLATEVPAPRELQLIGRRKLDTHKTWRERGVFAFKGMELDIDNKEQQANIKKVGAKAYAITEDYEKGFLKPAIENILDTAVEMEHEVLTDIGGLIDKKKLATLGPNDLIKVGKEMQNRLAYAGINFNYKGMTYFKHPKKGGFPEILIPLPLGPPTPPPPPKPPLKEITEEELNKLALDYMGTLKTKEEKEAEAEAMAAMTKEQKSTYLHAKLKLGPVGEMKEEKKEEKKEEIKELVPEMTIEQEEKELTEQLLERKTEEERKRLITQLNVMSPEQRIKFLRHHEAERKEALMAHLTPEERELMKDTKKTRKERIKKITDQLRHDIGAALTFLQNARVYLQHKEDMNLKAPDFMGPEGIAALKHPAIGKYRIRRPKMEKKKMLQVQLKEPVEIPVAADVREGILEKSHREKKYSYENFIGALKIKKEEPEIGKCEYIDGSVEYTVRTDADLTRMRSELASKGGILFIVELRTGRLHVIPLEKAHIGQTYIWRPDIKKSFKEGGGFAYHPAIANIFREEEKLLPYDFMRNGRDKLVQRIHKIGTKPPNHELDYRDQVKHLQGAGLWKHIKNGLKSVARDTGHYIKTETVSAAKGLARNTIAEAKNFVHQEKKNIQNIYSANKNLYQNPSFKNVWTAYNATTSGAFNIITQPSISSARQLANVSDFAGDVPGLNVLKSGIEFAIPPLAVADALAHGVKSSGMGSEDKFNKIDTAINVGDALIGTGGLKVVKGAQTSARLLNAGLKIADRFVDDHPN